MNEPTRVIGARTSAVGWVVQLTGRRKGRDWRLGRVTRIGRDSTRNDLILDEDNSSSAEHAKIRVEGGRFVLYDLGSSNGTLINERLIQKQTLEDGDEITIGRTRFMFKEVREK